ncbi:hypothetical protein BSZ19_14600 [Bradyrhizobium japonicum]|jgi:hypothetical protein|uniref:Uncharacterized protein n=1 Tax=Bradyrhizobium japonicum TaxID=375 RepID=A0A1Y2JS97_BRAJP|nr:hypothetical protein BSZ19_14600 [Bradyrhizobium japonicum]
MKTNNQVSSSADCGENSLRQIKGDFLSMENNEAAGSSAAASGVHGDGGRHLVWSGVNSRE